jgi:hypothetical protein
MTGSENWEINKRIILILILNYYDVCEPDACGSGYIPYTGCYEYSNGASVSTKHKEFLEVNALYSYIECG